MAEQKIFAGPRLRRLRNSMGLTQTAMANELDISPSYLNLLERNQRPLTVQLIIKLASVYDIDLNELRGPEGGLALALREVFADPLLARELPSPQELIEVADAAPNAASGIVKLYRAYRESVDRLSDLSEMLAREGREPNMSSRRLPFERVQEQFENRENYYGELEQAAERLSDKIGIDNSLRAYLQNSHGVGVQLLPFHAMSLWRRRFDRHSMRLFVSERLSNADQVREIAMELCRLELSDEITAQIEKFDLEHEEAKRIARFELLRYAAHALLMPYERFHATAIRSKYDMDLLCGRFSVTFEQAANRLTTLVRPKLSGIPFFLMEVDEAGNRLRRCGAAGFPQTRFGGRCPKLPVHSVFGQPDRISVDFLEMPDGARYLSVAATIDGPRASYPDPPRRTAILLVCDEPFAGETVYGGDQASPTTLAVGPACRLCERQACLARAEPPLTRPLGLDETVSGLSAFDFQ